MNHRRPDASFVTPSRAAALAALPLALAACAGPPITSPIEGEPICPDFETGAAHTKMIGSLKNPVQLTIKTGANVAFKTTISGLRTDKDIATRVLLADDNDTLTLEWAQCENERAPKPLESAGREPKGTAKFECGNAAVYKTEQLATKKGDPKSHAITFPTPPNAACWQSTAPPVATAAPTASATAAPEAADAGSPDAAAESADAGPGDAGAADAGPADAGKDASKAK